MDRGALTLAKLRTRARELKRETYALYFACRDPRTPWYAKVLAGAIVAYALSPIDLIPDFVPVLGYVDDLVIVPLGLSLALRLVPDDVMVDCRARAATIAARPTNRAAAAVIIAIWVAAAVFVVWLLYDLMT